MIPLPEMQRRVLDAVDLLPVERIGLREVHGLVLAADVMAANDVPPFANSAMDGYAVRGDDVGAAPVTLEVIEEVAAGSVPSREVVAGTATKIMTGAPLPAGADTVVKVEDTSAPDSTHVTIDAATPGGTAVRAAGGDMQAGSLVLAAGTRLTPLHVGVLSAVGEAWPAVRRRPLVAVMSTGDEVVPPEQPVLEPGQIRDANRIPLRGLVEEMGAGVVDYGIVPDDPRALRQVLNHAAAACDVVVSSGGVSMGEYDVVKQVFSGGDKVEFYKVAMQPAKPLGFGVVGGKPFFGLPGNPVSVVVAFEQFVRPAILAMMGSKLLYRPRVPGVWEDDVSTTPEKTVFVRVVTRRDPDGRWRVRRSGGQSSNVLTALAAADAFAVVPVGSGRVRAGDAADLEQFRWPETRTREEVLGD
jgi:molybdenum cofactor synthesis domain-containing protein